MSAAQDNVISKIAGQQVKPGQVFISGRVHLFRREKGREGPFFVTLVRTPAEDEFSSPSTIEILSKNKLGDKGEDIKVTCKLTGYQRYFNRTDQQTGETASVATADNRLTVIE